MDGRVPTATPSSRGWRVAALFLLEVEVLWWAANTVVYIGQFNHPAIAELVFIIPVALMLLAPVLTILAVFPLIRAPRGGIWLGLGLQGIVGIHALVLLLIGYLVGAFELAMGVRTAPCLFRRDA